MNRRSGAEARSGPRFLGIGAVKSGTTWLHEMLRRHPDVWLPPIKELRYFDQPEYNLIRRLRGGGSGRYDYTYWRQRFDEFLSRPATLRHPRLVGWHLRYFFLPRSPSWYTSLFPDGAFAGEITPLYAPMPEDKVARVARELPHLRILYLLRDPIDRTWSHIRMRCLGLPGVDGDPARITEELVLSTVRERDLTDRWLFRHSRYHGNLRRWLRHFPRERVLIGFFGELERDPAGLLGRICDFLGIAPPEPSTFPDLGRPRNPRPSALTLPRDLETVFARRLVGDLRRLADLVGGPTRDWLERAESAARTPLPEGSRFARQVS